MALGWHIAQANICMPQHLGYLLKLLFWKIIHWKVQTTFTGYNFLPQFFVFFFHCSVFGYLATRDRVPVKLLPYWSRIHLGSDLCIKTELEEQVTN